MWSRISLLVSCSLFAVAGTALWAQSYFRHGLVSLTHVESRGGNYVARFRNFEWIGGKFAFHVANNTLLAPEAYDDLVGRAGRGWTVRFDCDSFEDPDFARFGPSLLGGQHLHSLYSAADFRGVGTSLLIPFWWVVPLLWLPPVRWLCRRHRARRRLASGCCVHCGYDVRASSDRCPECGAGIRARPHDAVDAIGRGAA